MFLLPPAPQKNAFAIALEPTRTHKIRGYDRIQPVFWFGKFNIK